MHTKGKTSHQTNRVSDKAQRKALNAITALQTSCERKI